MSQEVTAQQRYVQIAMAGMAAQTGMSGSATLPATKNLAIGPRKNMCIRYMPNESFERPVTAAGAFFASMQENIRRAELPGPFQGRRLDNLARNSLQPE